MCPIKKEMCFYHLITKDSRCYLSWTEEDFGHSELEIVIVHTDRAEQGVAKGPGIKFGKFWRQKGFVSEKYSIVVKIKRWEPENGIFYLFSIIMDLHKGLKIWFVTHFVCRSRKAVLDGKPSCINSNTDTIPAHCNWLRICAPSKSRLFIWSFGFIHRMKLDPWLEKKINFM